MEFLKLTTPDAQHTVCPASTGEGTNNSHYPLGILGKPIFLLAAGRFYRGFFFPLMGTNSATLA